MCVCKCGAPTDCDEKLCPRCYLDSLSDDVSRNIAVGGRFYGMKLLPEDTLELKQEEK